MDKMPFWAVLLQSIPESIIIFTLGLTLMGVKLEWKKILIAATISSLVGYAVRYFPLPYGIHTALGVLVVFILIKKFFTTSYPIALSSALLGIISIVVTETLYLPIAFRLLNISLDQMWHNYTLRLLLFLPELVFLSLITYLIIKYKIILNSSTISSAIKNSKNSKHGKD